MHVCPSSFSTSFSSSSSSSPPLPCSSPSSSFILLLSSSWIAKKKKEVEKEESHICMHHTFFIQPLSQMQHLIIFTTYPYNQTIAIHFEVLFSCLRPVNKLFKGPNHTSWSFLMCYMYFVLISNIHVTQQVWPPEVYQTVTDASSKRSFSSSNTTAGLTATHVIVTPQSII